MLTPGLANLLEAVVVVSTATHSVNILRDKRMVVARQGNPIDVHGPFVTRISPQGEAHAAVDGARLGLHKIKQLADDDVGAGDSPRKRYVQRR